MKHNDRPDSDNRSNRPRRSAVGGANAGGMLNVIGSLDPNYNYRTVNDEGSRIEEMKSYGYEIAPDEDLKYGSSNPTQTGSAHTVVVDKRTGKKGVLMRQPIDYHEEDRVTRAKAIDKTEESMFRKLKTDEGRYGDVERTNSLARKLDD
jgi:hypothetical protein